MKGMLENSAALASLILMANPHERQFVFRYGKPVPLPPKPAKILKNRAKAKAARRARKKNRT